jgi:hypothetical protein
MPAFPATPAIYGGHSVRQYKVKAAEDWKLGAALVLDGTPELTECGADPAAILGFAAEPVTAGVSSDPEGALLCLVNVASEGQKFWMSGDNAPLISDVNKSYGIAVDGDGIWYVDGTEAVNTRVYVHQVDLDRNLYLVSVLAANRQAAP